MGPSNAFAKALFVCTATTALTAQGAGFYLSEVGTPGSLGTAGVANPTNTWGADAAWANPAGMSYLDEQHLIAGLQVLVPKIEFNSKSVEDTVTGRPVSGNDGGNAGGDHPELFLRQAIVGKGEVRLFGDRTAGRRHRLRLGLRRPLRHR